MKTKSIVTEVHTQLLEQQRARVAQIREKRRIRLATIAARYWLREARCTIRRRASSKVSLTIRLI